MGKHEEVEDFTCCKDLHELLLHLIRSNILLSDNKVVGYERYNLAA